MPTYESRCAVCNTNHVYITKIANMANTPICCDVQTAKQISTPMIGAMTWTGHKGMLIGNKWIETGAEYNRHMRDNNMLSQSESEQTIAATQKRQALEYDAGLTASVMKALEKAGS